MGQVCAKVANIFAADNNLVERVEQFVLVCAGAESEGGAEGLTVADAIAALAAQVEAGEISAEDAYTAAGAPDCAALSRVAGRKISAAERDAAMAATAAGGE